MLQWVTYCVRIFVLLNVYSWVLNGYLPPKFTPNVMVLGGEASEWWLGHEGGVLMNGIGAVIKETPQISMALPGEDTDACPH